MFESKEQLSQNQRRRGLIKQILQFKDAKGKEGGTQKQYILTLEKQIENATLEAQIKQFDCQQIQHQPDIKLQENIFCMYNSYKKAQFLCCSEYCNNHSIICGEQSCKCVVDHEKCSFTSIQSFCHQIASKTQQPIPKQIELYFQVKSVIYQHMANRISQERQALMDWQKDTYNDSALFLYGLKNHKAIVCHAPKVKYQKINSNHKKCRCFRLRIRKKQIGEDKEQIIKTICKNIHKKYSSMIEYFDQKVDQLQYHKKYANLSSAEFIFIDFLKDTNAFIEKSQHKELDSTQGLQEMKIVAGRAIFFAIKQNKKKSKKIDSEKFSINRIRRIWKGYSEKIFRLFVEGNAMNELFLQIEKLGLLKVHSVQDLRSQIDKIIQSISQGQEYLFSRTIFIKKLVLANLQQNQLCTELKKYKGREVNQLYSSNKKQRLSRYREVKFDQVYISNDRLQAALNDIETIKELGNLRNITKLEISWCQKMKAQVSMEILNTMPHLKQLALLDHSQKLCQNFMNKLCQFKQLKLFYINSNSHPEYYRSFNEDRWFIDFFSLEKDNLPSIKQLLELSKLPKLQNIQISLVNDVNSAQVIRNMKSLRHLTLGYDWYKYDKVDAILMKQLCEQRALITLSLIGVEVESKQVDYIITNNPHLKTIIIRSNENNINADDGTVECMANLFQLQNLCISRNKAIKGSNLNKLDNLIMLEIWSCPNVNKKQMKEALRNMHKLQHLKINDNRWFDDEVLMSVQSCKQLAYLDIESTLVSCKGLKHLEGLTRLNVLICGNTKINGKNLIELSKKIATINRLSIINLDVNDNQLLQISANCQALTHLDIRVTEIAAATLFKIKHLKVVRSRLNEDSKNKLREAGIKTYW